MRKTGLLVGAIIIAVVFAFIGYSVGTHSKRAPENDTSAIDAPLKNNMEKNVEDEDVASLENNLEKNISAVGIYHCQSWNGREATLILNEDGTCRYPGFSEANASWKQDDNEKVVIALESGEHEAILVNSGIILHETLFVKLK